MKCISLHQPWAWLCVTTSYDGKAEKQYETRHWPTSYRGPLLIHASKKWSGDQQYMYGDRYFHDSLMRHFGRIPMAQDCFDFGAIIGRVDLVNCVRVETIRESLGLRERSFGNYENGRYAWQFSDPIQFAEPLVYRGNQGLFEVNSVTWNDYTKAVTE